MPILSSPSSRMTRLADCLAVLLFFYTTPIQSEGMMGDDKSSGGTVAAGDNIFLLYLTYKVQ